MVEKVGEMVGVECEVCHNEAFHLVEREVTIVVKCCPRCVAKVDYEQEEQTIKEANKAMGKKERLYFLKDKSFEWANNLHGKKVEIYWDVNMHQVFCTTNSPYKVQGTAYKCQNASGGWGQVKVIIEACEWSRVKYICHGVGCCGITGKDMYFRRPYECKNTECSSLWPSLDGKRFGLPLAEEEGWGYSTMLSWGLRASLVEVGSVAQGLEHPAHNRDGAGSNPAGPTIGRFQYAKTEG